MKSLALRAVALCALGLFAHTIKPFTTENITGYAADSAHSFATWLPEWLPATTLTRWEKTAVLASVVGQAWTDVSENNRAGWRSVLASNLSVQTGSAALTNEPNDAQCPFSKARARRKVIKPFPAQRSSEEVALTETPVAPNSWQTETVPETNSNPHEGEPMAAPVTPVTLEAGKALTFQNIPLPALSVKRDACEMPNTQGTPVPVPTQEAEIEAAPAAAIEVEIAPTMTPGRSRRPGNMLEIEIQPVRYRLSPQSRRQLINLQKQKPLTQC